MEEQMIEPRVRVNGVALARYIGKPVSIMGTVLNVSFRMIKYALFLICKYISVSNVGLFLKCSLRKLMGVLFISTQLWKVL